MRVLLVCNMYPSTDRPFGGTFVSRRAEALSARGHEVRPVGLRTVGVGVLARTARLRGRPPESAPPVAPFEDYLLPVGLRRRLSRRLDTGRLPRTRALADQAVSEGVELVHGHGMYLFPAGSVARDVARLAGIPYVVTVHGQDINTLLRGRRARYREVLQEAAAVTCVSHNLASTVSTLVDGHTPVHVVPNGYDPDTFFGGAEQPAPGSAVLFVGNLETVKGADRLPDLWRSLRALRPDVTLDVVGSGRLEPRLRDALPGVRLHGQVSPEEVGARMRGADVLVLPSRSEGYPTVVSEAYACGLPVVACDVGGVSEAVRVPEHLVPPRAGVEGLARAVVDLLEERPSREEVALLARGRTWADVAEQEERVYLDAVSRSRTSSPDPDRA